MDPIVFLPGITGSWLYRNYLLGTQRALWGPFGTAFDTYRALAINPDGTDVFPTVSAGPVIQGPREPLGYNAQHIVGYYGDFVDGMRGLGWTVYPIGTDWRRLPESQAPSIVAKIQGLIGDRDFHLVAHSQGTRFARWVYNQFALAGKEAQIKTVCELCPPVLGAWNIVLNLMGNGDIISALAIIESVRQRILWAPFRGLVFAPGPGSYQRRILEVIWTLPGVLELLPSDAGDQDDTRRAFAARLWQRSWWSWLPFVTQQALDQAHVAVVRYQNVEIPKAIHWVCFARGFTTVNEVDTLGSNERASVVTQVRNNLGDGQVNVDDLGVEDVNYVQIFGEHAAVMGAPWTYNTVDGILKRVPFVTPPAQGQLLLPQPIVPTGVLPDHLDVSDGLTLIENYQTPPDSGIQFVPPPFLPASTAPAHCPDTIKRNN